MMSAIFASRLLGQLRDTVIAYRFGQNEWTDAYRAAFQLPDLLFFMVAGGALSSSLIPIFSEYWNTNRKEEAWRLFSTVTLLMFTLISLLVLLAEIFTRPLVALMFGGFEPFRLNLTISLTRIVLPAQICFLLGGLMMATLYARHHFWVPALGPNIYNLGIIFGGLVLAVPLGIWGLAWGALLGALIGNVMLPLWMMGRLRSRFVFAWDTRHPGVRQVFQLMLPVMLGLSLPGVYMLILRMFASWLPPGAISALDNANRQMQAPLGIIGQAIGLAIFPTMAALAAQQDWSTLRAILQQGLQLVWYLTLPSIVLLLVLAEDISRLLLQYGQFRSTDTQMVAACLRAFSVGLFAWSGQALIARAFFSLKDSFTPVLIGSLVTLLFIPTCWILMNLFKMGYVGLAVATSLAAAFQMGWMLRVLKRRLPVAKGKEGISLVRHVSLCFLTSLLVGLLGWLLRVPVVRFAQAHGWQPHLTSLGLLLGVGGSGLLLYWLLTRRLGLPEADYLLRAIRKQQRPSFHTP